MRKGGNESRFRAFSTDTFPFDETIKSDLQGLRWKSAWAKIPQDQRTSNHPSTRFLLARLAFENNDFDFALTMFDDEALKKDPLLGIDSKIWAAKSAFEAKKFLRSSAILAEIPPQDKFWKAGSLLFSSALIQSGKIKEGIRALKAGLAMASNAKESPERLYEIGKALFNSRKSKPALLAWRKLLIAYPGHKNCKKVYEELNRSLSGVLADNADKIRSFSDLEKLEISRHLFDSHLNNRTIKSLSTIENSKNNKVKCEGLYLYGRTYTKLRKHKDAIPWYQKALKSCSKNSVFYRKSLYQIGRSEWNASHPSLALNYFKRLEKEFQGHSYADDAMLYQGRILIEKGDIKAAHKIFNHQLKKYPKGDMAADAQWYLFHDAFAAGRYKAALKIAEKFEEIGDEYSIGRLPYFVARASQLSMKKQSKVIEAYKKVVKEYPLSYYALLAAHRLKSLTKKEEGLKSCWEKGAPKCQLWSSSVGAGKVLQKGKRIKIPAHLKGNVLYRKGLLLTRLGLLEDAKIAFRDLRTGITKKDLWALAKILDTAGVFSLSHDIARRRTGKWENTFPSSKKPNPRWSLSYPQPFYDNVSHFTKKNDVDSEIVYAIMREESGFNPYIRSWAGARGLLQLMPSTARTVAKGSGISLKKADALLEARNAIEIGTAYMSELSDQGLAHPAFIIAGYNGGWGNVSRWLRKTKTDQLDLFVEEIPYGQTRNYTKRVLRSYWAYNIIYKNRPLPPLPLKIASQVNAVKK